MTNVNDIVIEDKVIETIVGEAMLKPAENQNTDDIMPARYLKEITFKNMGEYVYADERFKDGEIVKDHPFNKYKNGKILIAGANYGCGSSREHAPQGLMRFGINAIVAPSYAEIFASNCASLGIVAVTVDEKSLKQLINDFRDYESIPIYLGLKEKIIRYGEDVKFDIPEGRRQAFLKGTWDAMAVLQQNQEGIKKTAEKLDYLRFK